MRRPDPSVSITVHMTDIHEGWMEVIAIPRASSRGKQTSMRADTGWGVLDGRAVCHCDTHSIHRGEAEPVLWVTCASLVYSPPHVSRHLFFSALFCFSLLLSFSMWLSPPLHSAPLSSVSSLMWLYTLCSSFLLSYTIRYSPFSTLLFSGPLVSLLLSPLLSSLILQRRTDGLLHRLFKAVAGTCSQCIHRASGWSHWGVVTGSNSTAVDIKGNVEVFQPGPYFIFVFFIQFCTRGKNDQNCA